MEHLRPPTSAVTLNVFKLTTAIHFLVTYGDGASFDDFTEVWVEIPLFGDSVILEYEAAPLSNRLLAFRSNIIHYLQGYKGMRFLRNVGNRLPIMIPQKGILTYRRTSRHSLPPNAGDKIMPSNATTPPRLRDVKFLGEKFTLYIIWATVMRIRITHKYTKLPLWWNDLHQKNIHTNFMCNFIRLQC